MSPQWVGILAFVALIGLIFARVPVAVALLLVAGVGYAAIDGVDTALTTLGTTPFDLAQAYSLSVVPLFLLMGIVVARTEIARELYAAANALFSGRRGGLAMATIGACAGFGAVCGSSLATASTMTQVSMPEMRRYGYPDAVACGVVASGGTLGILIPPSIVLVIYAIVAQESVPALFAAALLPGLVLAALHVGLIALLATIRPQDYPVSPRANASERLVAVVRTWKMLLIFSVAVIGIYVGWFSPTEAAAVGAFLAILIGFVTRQLKLIALWQAMRETVIVTGSLFVIAFGAFMFAYFVVQTRIPATLAEWVNGLAIAPTWVILFFVAIYLVLGCFLDTISMLLITVPVFLPIAESLGYSPVWFGVLVVIVAEIGLITPPVGLNLFVIRAQQGDIALLDTYRGIVPFLAVHLANIGLLIAVPGLALWLPGWLY